MDIGDLQMLRERTGLDTTAFFFFFFFEKGNNNCTERSIHSYPTSKHKLSLANILRL